MAFITFQPSDYFNTVLYTGNGSTQSITGVGFQPDMTWGKARSTTTNHVIQTPVQGLSTAIFPNLNNAESTGLTNAITSFDTDGFSLGDWSVLNASSQTFVSWNWRAGAGAGSSNTDGSINTTSTSVNTTAGFSISKYTGTGSAATIGHGLGAVPKMILMKKLSSNVGWIVYHHGIGANKYLRLNTTDAEATDTNMFNNTTPTSSVFSLGTDSDNNGSGATYIAYCFAEKKGFSKFGSYTGNGNANGTFVYTGFKPGFVMIKYVSPTSGTGNWNIMDTARSPHNIVGLAVSANTNGADDGGDFIDILSNGFKPRSTSSNRNENGSTYIYMAFAEEPLVSSNNIPATAR